MMQLKVAFSLKGWLAADLAGTTFDLADPTACVSFEKLTDGDLIEHESAGDVLVTSTGPFRVPRKILDWLDVTSLEPMPPELATRTHERTRQLRNSARRVVQVVQWVTGRMHDFEPTKSFRNCEFQVEGGPWRLIEPEIDVKVSFGRPFRTLDEIAVRVICQVLGRGGYEPLSNVLLREAWSLLATSPRSALVLGIASLESCVKHLIITCIPDSKWLVENVPSPPIESMLRSFINELNTKAKIKGKVVPPPKSLLDAVKNAVAARNRVVHGVSQDVSSESVRAYLRAIADINVLMDVYGGYTWAMKNLSVEAAEALTQSLGPVAK